VVRREVIKENAPYHREEGVDGPPYRVEEASGQGPGVSGRQGSK
jgi:hypothetical protein